MTRLDEKEKAKTMEPPSFAMFYVHDVWRESRQLSAISSCIHRVVDDDAGNMKRWSFHAAEQRLITNTNLPVVWCVVLVIIDDVESLVYLSLAQV